MFRGRYEHAIDSKGRTSLPSKFRDVLVSRGDARLVLLPGLDSCVVAYPMREWLEFEERLGALPQFDPAVANLRRIYVSGAIECEVDRNGRVLVPLTLREHAGLERQALWAGMGRHVELWSRDGFERMRSAALGDVEGRARMARKLAELGL